MIPYRFFLPLPLLFFFLSGTIFPRTGANPSEGWLFATGYHLDMDSSNRWTPLRFPADFSFLSKTESREWITLSAPLQTGLVFDRSDPIPVYSPGELFGEIQIRLDQRVIYELVAEKESEHPLRSDPIIPIVGGAKHAKRIFIHLRSRQGRPPYLAGPPQVLETMGSAATRRSGIHFVQSSLTALFLFMGLYHLVIYMRRTKEFTYLLFGIFSVLISLYWSMFTPLRPILFANQVEAFHLELISLFFATAFYIWFHLVFFHGKGGILNQINFLYHSTLAFLIPFTGLDFNYLILDLWQVFLVFFILTIAIDLLFCYRRKKEGALAILIASFFLFGGALFDMGIAQGLVNFFRLSPMAFAVYTGTIAGMLANQFARVHSELEDLTVTLENRVQQRTGELQDSLQEIRQLKEKQDGDYFLTSLLLTPLVHAFPGPEPGLSVSWETILKQKKQFRFRNRNLELGGDLILIRRLRIRGRKHLLFVNADAMGKSLQGAGGALVFGSVFGSLVSRTMEGAPPARFWPERWLYTAVQELDVAFKSFDGSMMASAFIGLVDEQNGTLYYINSEHPGTVLLRDGNSRFLPDQQSCPRLGMPGVEPVPSVQVFQLQAGDCLIAGSDGRDDVLVMKDDSPAPAMNEDENRFLRLVEASGGRLQQIAGELENRSTLTDDLSLVQIRFHASVKGRYREMLHTAITEYRKRNFYASVILLEELMELRPARTDTLRLLVNGFIKMDRLDEAIDHLERLRLRNMDDGGIKSQLANLYEMQWNRQKMGSSVRRYLTEAA